MHRPVRTSYIQPCHGHARRVPDSLPSLSGPPLWAQTSPRACTRSPTRTRTRRAPSASTSIGRPTATPASGTRMAVTRTLSRRRRGAARSCTPRPSRSPAAPAPTPARAARPCPKGARVAEADQEVDVLGARFLLADGLEQEVARVGVGAVGVDGRAPARELRDVLIVLTDPGAELLPRELAAHPALREGVQAAVAGGDGILELGAELAHGSPPGGGDDASRVGSSQATAGEIGWVGSEARGIGRSLRKRRRRLYLIFDTCELRLSAARWSLGSRRYAPVERSGIARRSRVHVYQDEDGAGDRGRPDEGARRGPPRAGPTTDKRS